MALAQSTKAFDGGRIKGFIAIPNCIEVDLQWTLASGKVVKNVLHGRVALGFQATAAIAEAVRAAFVASASWTAWAVYMHTTASLKAVLLRDLRGPNFPYVQSTGGPNAGTGAAVALAPGVALIVTERTANAGRGFRGRVYLPGLDSAAEIAGTGLALGAAQTAAINLLTALQTALTGQSITLTLAQRGRQAYLGRTGTAFLARPANVVDVSSFATPSAALASQRRRSYTA